MIALLTVSVLLVMVMPRWRRREEDVAFVYIVSKCICVYCSGIL